MALSFRKILAHAPGDQLTLSEQMAMMVDDEWTMRENRRLARLIRSAHLSVADACLENAWCDPARGLEKSLVRELGTAKWLRNKQNVIIVGKTGVGKTQPTQHPVSIRELRRDGHRHGPNTPAARPDVPPRGAGPPAKDGSVLYGRKAAECVRPHSYRIDKFCEIAETGAYLPTC